MTECNIVFQPEGLAVPAEAGQNLMDVASGAGLHINASCAGAGVCGRCRVEIVSGSVRCETGPGAFFSPEEYARGLRLACECFVEGPAEVVIPPESRADASVYARAEGQEEVTVADPDPLVRDLEVALSPPAEGDNLSDSDRLLAGLASDHGLAKPEMELAALLELPQALREGGFAARVAVFQAEGQPRILSVRPALDRRPSYALAVDIGTTTVWARLVNLATAENTLSRGDLNGQISFGEDVISRIVFAAKGDGLAFLKERVVENINSLLDLLLKEHQVERERLALVVVAGNTTMSHLFAGLNPKSIRLAPYVPAAGSWPTLRAAELGLQAPASTPLLVYPAVSSYVGGDIVAGVLASGMYKSPELTLFIDVGTNGEIVIGNQDWMTCAACSAGPAFEGGGVKFGMRAAPGAVEQFYFDPAARGHRLTVIGGPQVKPIGICGSGLINITAELFLAGVLDPQGKFVPEAAPALVREGEDRLEYLLEPKAGTALGRDLVLTEIDVENLIRAKGAMYSGYQTLLEGVGLAMNDLERVIIGGGFGKSLNLGNAMAIGLLPELPVEKFTYIGNSSLSGATLAALSGSLWHKAQEIKAGLTNFELSETPGYMDYYMASQFLPHTRGDLFPLTRARRDGSVKP